MNRARARDGDRPGHQDGHDGGRAGPRRRPRGPRARRGCSRCPSQPAIPLDRGADAAAELIIGRDAALRRSSSRGATSRAGTPRCAGPSRAPARRCTTSAAATASGSTGAPSRTASSPRGDVVRVGGWIGVVTAHARARWRRSRPASTEAPRSPAAVAPLRQAAPSDLPIVLEGETGTGKEVVARAIHAWSGRRGPFVAVNCAALPEALAEGELFGYRRGAFTGADRASPGVFRSAEGGHAAARRGVGSAAGAAGQAAARARAARGAAARRDPAGPDRRPHRRRGSAVAAGRRRAPAVSAPICWRGWTG